MSKSRQIADIFTTAQADYWNNSNIPDPLQTQSVSLGSTAVGWYTIATLFEGRALGNFSIQDTTSSAHHSLHFYAAIHYSRQPRIRVELNTYHIRRPFRYLRIMSGGVYDGAMVQIYLDYASSGWKIWLHDNTQVQGWEIKPAIPNGTDPGDLKNYAGITTQGVLVDLNY